MAADELPPLWAARLRAERERRSWNKHEMARRLQKATGRPYPPVTSLVRQILGWEKGEHFPRDWTAAYAAAFGIDEAELFPRARRRFVDVEDDMRRRALLGLFGATAAARLVQETVGRQAALVDALAATPTERDADAIRDMLRAFVVSDRQFGGVHARQHATEFLATVIRPRLHAAARSVPGRRIFAVSAEFTMRVSAMHLDAGYDEASLMFLGDALSMAQQVDDPTLTAWVLSRRGEYELDMAARARCDHADSAYAAHIDKAVDYMGGATRMARKAPPVAQAFIRAKEALAWSMAGDRVETERALGLMWDSYADAGRRPEPGWMNAYGGANLQHEAARCYCNVGMGEHAIRAAEDSLSTRTARRPRAFSLGMLAIGHAQAGNVRGACGFARELLESAASLGSFRVLVRMAEVVRALSPYRHDPDVTELRAAAQPVLCSLDR